MKKPIDVRPIAAMLGLFSIVMILMGGAMIYQYAKLTNFIDCQAQYNISTNDARDSRLPAQQKAADAQGEVLIALQSGDRDLFTKAVAKAVRAQEEYKRVQTENPYKSPSDFCDGRSR